MSNAIVFYVSGHGYGHATRVIEVINAILAERPETRVGVRTETVDRDGRRKTARIRVARRSGKDL